MLDQSKNNGIVSTISENTTVNKIQLQEELYNNEEKEELNIDMQKTIQRHVKKKFLTNKIS